LNADEVDKQTHWRRWFYFSVVALGLITGVNITLMLTPVDGTPGGPARLADLRLYYAFYGFVPACVFTGYTYQATRERRPWTGALAGLVLGMLLAWLMAVLM